MNQPTIRALERADLPEAMALVWRVFSEFEAPEYADEGIAVFRDYIDTAAMEARMAEGLRLWGCLDGERIVGVLAVRPPAHISLLFVDREYHRQGIARRLWETAREGYRRAGTATVNSSPYALAVYRRLGFADTSGEQVVNGLRFIPMRYTF